MGNPEFRYWMRTDHPQMICSTEDCVPTDVERWVELFPLREVLNGEAPEPPKGQFTDPDKMVQNEPPEPKEGAMT